MKTVFHLIRRTRWPVVSILVAFGLGMYVEYKFGNSAFIQKVDTGECSLATCFDYTKCPLLSTMKVFSNGPTFTEFSNTDYSHEACIVLIESNKALLAQTGNVVYSIVNQEYKSTAGIDRSVILAFSGFPHRVYREFDILLPYISRCKITKLRPLFPFTRNKFAVLVHWDNFYSTNEQDAFRILGNFQPSGQYSLLKYSVKHVSDVCSDILKDALYTVIFYRHGLEFGATLTECFIAGSIPVILYSEEKLFLPLDDIIEWNEVAIILPSNRASELFYVLKSISEEDVARYRQEGIRLYHQFFANRNLVIRGLLSVLSKRLKIPAPPLPEFKAESAYRPSRFAQTKTYEGFLNTSFDRIPEYFLGKVTSVKEMEKVFSKLTSFRTFNSQAFNLPNFPSYQTAFPNDLLKPMVNSTPYFRFLNSTAVTRFGVTDSLDFNHPLPPLPAINNTDIMKNITIASELFSYIGAVNADVMFHKNLGGNLPTEQFTIVLNSVGGDRLEAILKIVSHWKHLPYLNKLVIVWNNPEERPPDMWPKLDVPIFVANMPDRSLNNRFLPFDEIETDAILSLDDDVFLRHEEIIFAFRAWREERDRIVGFPDRHHSWNVTANEWVYHMNPSCQYSMILTKCAFIHKYYFYMYSYVMAAEIRHHIDRIFNCEDIAMNYLVSHLTRKPPLKVTLKRSFYCPMCKTGLSDRLNHLLDRKICLSKFAGIYGYMPLLFTQYRADSVLYHHEMHNMCFQNV